MFHAATEGSVAHFYSPIESAHNSDSEDDDQVSAVELLRSADRIDVRAFHFEATRAAS